MTQTPVDAQSVCGSLSIGINAESSFDAATA